MVPSVVSLSALDSKSVNAFVPSSVASAAASSLSLAPFQFIPVCSHHHLATRAAGSIYFFSHSSRIGQVVINCATVFCLWRIEVLIRMAPASFIAPTNDGLYQPPFLLRQACFLVSFCATLP